MKTSLHRSKGPLLRALGLSLLLPVSTSLAVDIHWNAGTGDFTDGANWEGGVVPGTADRAIISNGGTAQFTAGEHTVDQVLPGWNGQGTLVISDGIFNANGVTDIGRDFDGSSTGNFGRIEVSGDAVFNANGSFHLGRGGDINPSPDVVEMSDDAIGQLSLSGSSIFTQQQGYVVIGLHGEGVLEISDDAEFNHVDWGNIIVGEHPTGEGTVNQTGGSVSIAQVNDDGKLWIGRSGATGTYNLTNGSLTVGNNLEVGSAGTGEFIHNSGSVTVTDEIWVGQSNTGTGTYTLKGGILSVDSWIAIGREGGDGTFTMIDGTINKTGGGNLELGTGDGTSLLDQRGGTINLETGRLQLGARGANRDSTYKLSGGTLNINDWIAIANGDADGTLTMTGGTINKSADSAGDMVVGDGGAGTGTFTQSGGVVNLNGSKLEIGKNGTVTGIVELSGDAVFNAGTVSLTENSTQDDGIAHATLTLQGNSVLSVDRIDGNLFGLEEQGQSTIYFDGGILRANRDEPAFVEHIFTPSVEPGGLKIDSNGFEVTILDPLLDNGGAITKLGEGTVHLDGTTFYRDADSGELEQFVNETGDIIIEQGTLTINASSTVNGVVTVADDAEFGVDVHEEGDQLNLSSLSLGETTAASLNFDLGAFAESTVTPLVVGDLEANGQITVNVSGILATGTRKLVEYTNRTGTGSFVIDSLPIGVEAHIEENTTDGSIDLVVTYAASLVWEGSVDGQWDFSTANWFDISTDTSGSVFQDGNPVVFNDDAIGTTDIVLNTTVAPGTLAFANNGPAPEGDTEAVDGLDYTISGTGSITGDIDLVKSGNGNVTLDTVNDYTGATIINGGSITANTIANGGEPSSIGASSADASNLVLSNGELSYTGGATSTDRGFTLNGGANMLDLGNDLTLSGAIVSAEPSSLTLTGNGTLTLDGSDSHIAGDLWMTSQDGTEPGLVLNDTSLTIDSWLAIARGHSTTGLNSSIAATNSDIEVGNFSVGFANGLEGYTSTADLTLTDSTFTSNGLSNIGEAGGSEVTITLAGDSAFSSNARFALAQAPGSTGNMTIGGTSSLHVNAWFNIGERGTADLTLKDNASITTTGDFNVTDGEGSQAEFTMSGDTTVTVGNGTYVGKSTGTNGEFNMSGGTFTANGATQIGNSHGSVGVVNISGGKYEATSGNNFQIGAYGDGTWNQTGGVVNASGWLAIGRQGDETSDPQVPPSKGLLNISGGEFHQTQLDRPIQVAEGGIGTLTISGTGLVSAVGTVGEDTGVWLGWYGGGYSHGTVNLDGGTLLTHTVKGRDGQSTFNFNGGLLKAAVDADPDFMSNIDEATVLAGGARIDSNGNDIAISQILTGEGGLTKLGEGTLALTGDNTYTGATTVEAGGLGGTGAVGGNVTFATGTDFVVTGEAGTDGLTVGGTLDITGADLVGTGVLTEPVYIIASYSTLVGTFASVNVPGYDVEYGYEGANQIALVSNGSTVQTYEQWAAGFELDPATDGAKTADADSDGIENLAEFAMGLNPTTFDALPTATINGDFLELVYTRSLSAASQVNLVVEHADEVDGIWSTDGVTDVSIETVGNLETRKASVAIDGDPRCFLRLKASE